MMRLRVEIAKQLYCSALLLCSITPLIAMQQRPTWQRLPAEIRTNIVRMATEKQDYLNHDGIVNLKQVSREFRDTLNTSCIETIDTDCMTRFQLQQLIEAPREIRARVKNLHVGQDIGHVLAVDILSAFTHVQSITIDCSLSITSATLAHLSHAGNNLTCIKIRNYRKRYEIIPIVLNIDDETVNTILHACRKLENFELTGFYTITTVSEQKIKANSLTQMHPTSISPLVRMEETLVINQLHHNNVDATIQEALSQKPNLQTLFVIGNNLSSAGLRHICSVGDTLKNLQLDDCPNLNDDVFVNILRSCTGLTHIKM